MNANEMTADDVLAAMGSDPVLDAIVEANANTLTDMATNDAPVTEAKPARKPRAPKAEKPAKVEKTGKRTRATAHEVAMRANVEALSVALDTPVTVTRSDATRYMRALFNLNANGTVLMEALTVNEIELLTKFSQAVAASRESEAVEPVAGELALAA